MTIFKDDIVNDVMIKKKDRNTVRNCVESILRNIKNTLASDDGVMISGFGDFKIAHKKARIGRNPKMKISYEISEREIVVFSLSNILRKEMNSSAF